MCDGEVSSAVDPRAALASAGGLTSVSQFAIRLNEASLHIRRLNARHRRSKGMIAMYVGAWERQ